MRTSAGKGKLLLLSFLLLLALSACAPGGGQSASSLSNVPSGTGKNPEPGTDGKPHPAPNGHSESIVATSDLAFVGSDNHTLYAFDTCDGKVRWQYKMADVVQVYAAANGVVYATANSLLSALNTSTGALLWNYQAAQQLTQVVLSAGVIYANTAAGGNTSTLVALNATPGAPLWRYTSTTMTPGLLGVVDGVIYDLQMSGIPGDPGATQAIQARRASDGRLLWQASVDTTDGAVNGAPVTAHGIVYFATAHGALYAFDATTGQLRWHAAQADNQPPFIFSPISPVVVNGMVYTSDFQGISAYRASDGARQWQYKRANTAPFPTQPLILDGVIYYGDSSGLAVALRASDGTIDWQQQHTPGIERPLVVCDGLFISASVAGPVFALRTSDGALVWQSALSPTDEGFAEAVSAGVVYIGGDNGTVSALQASNGKQLWRYAIQELPVAMPPVFSAYVTFAPTVSYQQALEIVTNLGLKTFALCHLGWIAASGKDGFSDDPTLKVAATVNSAPLWMARLKATPGVKDAQSADGPIMCPHLVRGNGPDYLSQNQAGTYLRVTFTRATTYATALDGVDALGFRLADPCYEQARAQGKKPTWHPMSEAGLFGAIPALVLATTGANATTWATQLQSVAGFVVDVVPFKAAC